MKRARTIYIDDELWGRVRDLAYDERKSVSDLVVGLISDRVRAPVVKDVFYETPRVRVGGEGSDKPKVEKVIPKVEKKPATNKVEATPFLSKADVISELKGRISTIDQGWRDRVRACPK